MSNLHSKPKVIGVGLNKTATKSLAQCFKALGYQNQSYSIDAFQLYRQRDWPALFTIMEEFDSFEDWPWPLMFREIDQKYPDAKFILTTRVNPDVWYRSLCKMAVRMGPFNKFEQHIYGYAMPQGHREEHLAFYRQHNNDVRNYFANRQDKLLEICFDDGVSIQALTDFLNLPPCQFALPHENKSDNVYAGDSLWRAHLHRVLFQCRWYATRWLRQKKQNLRNLLKPGSDS
jgi:hypothetical protein